MYNYKDYIPNRSIRNVLLRLLNFVPDKAMIEFLYWFKLERKLNLIEPKRYTEKIQWYKLNYREPLMAQITDKADVREYVESKGLGSILNKCYGVYDTVEEVNFKQLPARFVLKDTLGSGSSSVIIVKDKPEISEEEIKTTMRKWLSRNRNRENDGREWAYHAGKKHRIIIEQFLEQEDEDLLDYKFFCFNGKPFCIAFDKDRFVNHTRNFYNMDWIRLNVRDKEYPYYSGVVKKPDNYDRMIEIACRLSEGFPALRVDLYNVNGTIYFGELTCYPFSGLVQFIPDDFDFILGEQFTLPIHTIN